MRKLILIHVSLQLKIHINRRNSGITSQFYRASTNESRLRYQPLRLVEDTTARCLFIIILKLFTEYLPLYILLSI